MDLVERFPIAMKVGWARTMLGLAYLISLTHGFQRRLGNTEGT
jgi:hypothetical protein